jgi:hypothetical protein
VDINEAGLCSAPLRSLDVSDHNPSLYRDDIRLNVIRQRYLAQKSPVFDWDSVQVSGVPLRATQRGVKRRATSEANTKAERTSPSID